MDTIAKDTKRAQPPKDGEDAVDSKVLSEGPEEATKAAQEKAAAAKKAAK